MLHDDIDPDVNSYNSLSTSCKYYLPDELGECVEKSHMTSNLPFIHINARSMCNKLEYIEILLKTIKNNFDILSVSETWENDLNSHLINIAGYCKVSSMRLCGAKGGGTALFVKPNFKFTVIDVTTVSFESVFI